MLGVKRTVRVPVVDDAPSIAAELATLAECALPFLDADDLKADIVAAGDDHRVSGLGILGVD